MIHKSASASGAICFWNLSAVDKAALSDRFSLIGLERYAPKERTDASALHQACLEYAGKRDTAIEKHKHPGKNGVSVVNIERDEDSVYFTTSFGAKVVDGRVVTSKGYANQNRLQELFTQHKGVVTGAALGKSLVEIVLARLSGVTLKESGGVMGAGL